MKHFLIITLTLLLGLTSFAQLTIGNGKHILEVTGTISTYANYRVLKPDLVDQKKNRFKLKDAQVQFEGRISDEFEYELQFDLAEITTFGGLMDAYVEYKGLSCFDIRLGYGKVPYSRSSLTSAVYSPFWQRAEYLRGNVFARRDVGLRLSKGFLSDKITLIGGMYTGLGEESLAGDNDASGRFEYIGRAEFAYPAKLKRREIDTKGSPVPTIEIGTSGRYSNKQQPEGEALSSTALGDIGMKVVDGLRVAYEVDANIMYKGFSLQGEFHNFRIEPSKLSSNLYAEFTPEDAEYKVLSTAFVGQLNYHIEPADLTLSTRYERFNYNDLATGLNERVGVALAYHLKGYNTMVKAQYWNVLEEEETIDPLKWDEQFRIGVQFLLK